MTDNFNLRLDKDALKNGMTIDSVYEFLTGMGVQGQFLDEEKLLFETVCHNHPGEGKHKLYYYHNTKLFNCYTDCGANFDIFELINKMHVIKTGEELELEDSIKTFVHSSSFLFAGKQEFDEEIDDNKEYVPPTFLYFDKNVLNELPNAIVDNWVEEQISEATQRKYGVKLNPSLMSAAFPHFDEFWNLLGIRQRILSAEDQLMYGKYRPLTRKGEMFSSPLSFYLFGLNHNGLEIRKKKKAIIYEGEKSVMKMDDVLGPQNNISVASFGMKFSRHQFEQLKSMGVEEIIFAFDRQFKQTEDSDFYKLIDLYRKINDRFSNQGVKFSFILDDEMISGYKDSPIDDGFDVFNTLYHKKRTIEEIEEEFQEDVVPPGEWAQPELEEEDDIFVTL
ncbi:MAG: hypothetical protein ABS916_09280 [Carnobacterium sp.]|uniref:hypothetical protein n=1 Tax=Carnobacterium sp. TaxID=48221 RepID=UPI00331517F8